MGVRLLGAIASKNDADRSGMDSVRGHSEDINCALLRLSRNFPFISVHCPLISYQWFSMKMRIKLRLKMRLYSASKLLIYKGKMLIN